MRRCLRFTFRATLPRGSPRPLRRALPQHEVVTAYERGWSNLNDGRVAGWCGLQRYTSPMDTVDIASLSPEQRLRLLEQIWDSLAATPDAVPVTSAQREELGRRLDELDRVGPVGIPWDEVLRKVRGQVE
jgi:putative addiction module component (TIGR02574 family)